MYAHLSLLSVCLLSACASAPVAPLNRSLVCDGPCTAPGAALSAWAAEALHRPGSRFEILEGGALRFVSCVPVSWGSGVRARQQAFLAEQLDRLRSGQPRGAGDACPDVPEPEVLLDTGSGPVPLALAPLDIAVVCDQSRSAREAACTPEREAALWRSWLRRAATGSRFVHVGVGLSRERAAVSVRTAAPGSAGRIAAGLTPPAWEPPAAPGSAIAEAVDLAVREIRPGGELYLLSDLRQVSDRRWDFEHRIPDPEAFRAWISASGLRLQPTGLRVQICGVHHRSTDQGSFHAAESDAIEAIWRDVLSGADALTLTCGDPS